MIGTGYRQSFSTYIATLVVTIVLYLAIANTYMYYKTLIIIIIINKQIGHLSSIRPSLIYVLHGFHAVSMCSKNSNVATNAKYNF